MPRFATIATLAAALLMTPLAASAADRASFHPGPVFTNFGPIADVDSDLPIPAGTVFKVVFNVSEAAKPGELSRAVETAARFINMHVAAGVPEKNVRVAVVIHGGASFDLVNDAAYARQNPGKTNGSAAAIAALIAHGTQFYLCGQSAAAHHLTKTDMLPGVKMSLSAMTALALLQQSGYTLNPD